MAVLTKMSVILIQSPDRFTKYVAIIDLMDNILDNKAIGTTRIFVATTTLKLRKYYRNDMTFVLTYLLKTFVI